MSPKHAEEMLQPDIPISQARILVCGVARNCAHSIAASIDALHLATQKFAEVRFHIVESDSTDKTVGILDDLTKQYRLTYQSEGKLRRTMPSRTGRIAHCRNQLVDLVKAAKFGPIDFVLVADMDELNESISAKSLASCWAVKVPWDVQTANQPDGYYDIWALRHKDWVPDDCWERVRQLEPNFGKKLAREIAVHSRQISIPIDAKLIEVDSAFGGLGLYRSAAFIAGKYCGSNPDGSEICEHVPFHAEVREAGFRIFINPALVNLSPAEHIGAAQRPPSQFVRRLGSLVFKN